MNSKLKAFVLAAVVASIAVLAVLPAEGASAASSSVAYGGIGELADGSGSYSYLDLVLDPADSVMVVNATVTDDTSTWTGTYYDWSGITSGRIALKDSSGAYTPLPAGDYTATVADADGNTIVSSTITVPAAVEDSYSLTITSVDGVTITAYSDETLATEIASGSEVVAGSTVYLKVVVGDDYTLNSVTYNGTPITADNGSYSFPMPSQKTTVTAEATAKTTPVDPTPHAIKVTVTGIEGVEVTAQVDGDDVKEAVSKATVKLVPGTYDSDKYSVAYTVNGEAVTGDSFTMPDKDVEVVAAFTEKTTVPEGISINGENCETVKDALAKAESGDVIVISKAIPAENVTLVDGVSISVTKDGSYTGTVTYDGSSVKFVKLGAGSVVAISGGSVDVSGNTFVGESEIQVAEGTMVLAGTVAKNASVTVDVSYGAVLEIGDLTADATSVITATGDGEVRSAADTTYYGPAIVDSEGAIASVKYSEGSKVIFDHVTYIIYQYESGSLDVRAGIGYYEIEYKDAGITLNDVKRQTIAGKVFYASDGAEYSVKLNEATLDDNPIDMVKKNGETVTEIKNPGVYDFTYGVYAGISDNTGTTITQTRWVDFGLIIDPVSASSLKAAVVPEETVYNGSARTIDVSEIRIYDAYNNDITDRLTISIVRQDEAKNVGTYTVTVSISGDVYEDATKTATFKITQADNTMALIPAEATWSSEKYTDGTVKYSLGTPEADGTVTITASVVLANGTPLELEDATITYAGDKDTFQAALDDLIASITAERYGQQVDQGYTLTLVLKSENGVNVKDGQATGTYTVTAYTQEKIRLVFTTGTDGVEVAQTGTTVTISGQVPVTDGKAVFQVNVSSPDTDLVTEKDVRGYTVVSLNGAASESAVFTAAENGAYITFTLSQPTTDRYDAQAYAAKPTDSRYYDSDVYTLDLSGLKLTAASFRGIILEKDGSYPAITYTQNQVYDLTGGAELTDNVKFYLPASNTGSYWTLTIDGVAKPGDSSTYKAGTVYLVDSDDRSLDGLIHFVATAAVDPEPEEQQAITITAAGYEQYTADANRAIGALAGKEVVDSSDRTMYVFFDTAVAGDLTVTVTVGSHPYIVSQYESVPAETYHVGAGAGHYVYWSFTPNTGTSIPADPASGDKVTITIADASAGVSAETTVVVTDVESQPEETQTISIYGAGYYEKAADANKAMSDYGASVSDASDKTMFVFYSTTVASDITVTVTIGGQSYVISKYEQTPSDVYADVPVGKHYVYWSFTENTGTSVPATYASGDVAVITVADASGASASITVGWSGGQTVPTPTPSTETTYTVFYVVDGAVVDSATQKDLKAGDALVFPTVEGKTIAWSGVESTAGLTATADAVYIGTTEKETPTVEYSTDLAMSVSLSNGRIQFVIAAYDGKAIPEGTVSLTYTVLEDALGIGVLVPNAHTIAAEDIHIVYSDGNATAYGYADIPADIVVYSYYGSFSSETISNPVQTQTIYYREA